MLPKKQQSSYFKVPLKGSFTLLFILAVVFVLTGRLNGMTMTRVYEERSKNSVIVHRFFIETSSSGYSIGLRSEKDGLRINQKYIVDENLAALSWDYEEPHKKTKVTATRKGNRIYLSGMARGKPINKIFKINELPWNQTFNIGLEHFALAPEKSMKFWSIGTSGPGNMKITTFKVKKKKTETITVNGKAVEAVHMKMSLTGILSIFWSGSYWYRKSDGRFVRYKGKSGPGTGVAIMELISENE
ncbi:MAG: hypothetical protein GTO45_31550 [Candidatus Aminicenantes bacterium]|nr:hypothetical protein [Candidatus Aminicenantes bacterium]NIM80610.1 hypothetical protein [Candidatus Aminicenantes bacterium]NIN19991.1 hypothetical protein [Candidatus Aminicenantes bacterium]NIN47969.1 hypothetical protein [Candidatus Aminicenantes bacterium]NIN89315.1 hypothetical protein [Candidatus Aminicenantes bacterium]